jgi:hypothetical protein
VATFNTASQTGIIGLKLGNSQQFKFSGYHFEDLLYCSNQSPEVDPIAPDSGLSKHKIKRTEQ